MAIATLSEAIQQAINQASPGDQIIIDDTLGQPIHIIEWSGDGWYQTVFDGVTHQRRVIAPGTHTEMTYYNQQ